MAAGFPVCRKLRFLRYFRHMTEEHAPKENFPPRPERRRAMLSATLLMDGGKSRVDCMIYNISEGGVFVKLAKPKLLPPTVDLLINKTRMLYATEMRWNRQSFAGLRFLNQGRVARF